MKCADYVILRFAHQPSHGFVRPYSLLITVRSGYEIDLASYLQCNSSLFHLASLPPASLDFYKLYSLESMCLITIQFYGFSKFISIKLFQFN